LSNDTFQLPVPWKPQVDSDCDTKYIPEEFASEPVHLTPPHHRKLDDISEEPYFEQFSYHGSRGSLGSFLSSTAENAAAFVS